MNIFDVYPERYQELLQQKVDKTRTNFASLEIPVATCWVLVRPVLTAHAVQEIQVFESEKQHYRMRAEFTIFHEGSKDSVGDSYYCMFDWPEPAAGAEAEDTAVEPEPAEDQGASKRPKIEGADGSFSQPQRKLTKKEKRKIAKKQQAAGGAPKKVRVRIDQFPRSAERINELMPKASPGCSWCDLLSLAVCRFSRL